MKVVDTFYFSAGAGSDQHHNFTFNNNGGQLFVVVGIAPDASAATAYPEFAGADIAGRGLSNVFAGNASTNSTGGYGAAAYFGYLQAFDLPKGPLTLAIHRNVDFTYTDMQVAILVLSDLPFAPVLSGTGNAGNADDTDTSVATTTATYGGAPVVFAIPGSQVLLACANVTGAPTVMPGVTLLKSGMIGICLVAASDTAFYQSFSMTVPAVDSACQLSSLTLKASQAVAQSPSTGPAGSCYPLTIGVPVRPTKSLHVGGAGAATLVFPDGSTASYRGLAAGQQLPVSIIGALPSIVTPAAAYLIAQY